MLDVDQLLAELNAFFAAQFEDFEVELDDADNPKNLHFDFDNLNTKESES